jgi:hypothetical protein
MFAAGYASDTIRSYVWDAEHVGLSAIMKVSRALMTLTVALACCGGDEPCAEYCRSVRGEAEAIGVALDCDASEWSEPDTCEECIEVFQSHDVIPIEDDCGGRFD